MNLQMTISEYLDFCQYQKRLDSKTIKAYRIDLQQFLKANSNLDILSITTGILEDYLETTAFRRKNTLRDIAVIELLFSTGMRISELCSLQDTNVDLISRNILIYGKGSKERHIQIGNDDVCQILYKYREVFYYEIQNGGYFFVNQSGRPLSGQAVRRIIKKYSSLASINLHITPHMFRHTFATSLLEADVDIRYIQEMLGHSSINITEIYTHVAMAKQRDILATKHPRKNLRVQRITKNFHLQTNDFLL